MLGFLRSAPRYDDPRRTEWGLVTTDTARCDGCKQCVKACPASVLVIGESGVSRMRVAGESECFACADCEAICPSSAIKLDRSYRYTGTYLTLDRGPMSPPRL